MEQTIKTDHNSDCAVYNEPAMANGMCDCGLIPACIDGINKWMKSCGQLVHEGESNIISTSFQAGFNYKAIIGEDLEYLLNEFKETELSLFDKFGKLYSQTKISNEGAELMRHLIFKLEEHIRHIDNTDWAF